MECAITLDARLAYVLPFMRALDGRKNEKGGGKAGGFVSLDFAIPGVHQSAD